VTGDVGKVTGADAPQFEFSTAVVVVVAVVAALAGDWEVEIAHAATCVVPPTELNRMTSPSREIAKHISSPTMARTILFTTTPSYERMHPMSMDLTDET
jgi:hypothetical protein